MGHWPGAVLLVGRLAGDDAGAVDVLARVFGGTSAQKVAKAALTAKPIRIHRNLEAETASLDDLRRLAARAARSDELSPKRSGELNVAWLLRTFDGMQHVAVIHPDNKSDIHFLTFTVVTRDKAVDFLARYALTHNLYYQPNEVRSDLGPPLACKADITRVRAIFADVDPNDEEAKEPGGLQRER